MCLNLTTVRGLASCSPSSNRHAEIKTAIYDMTVPLTTRLPRQNETDGVNYHFVSTEEFERLVKEEKMMEFGPYPVSAFSPPSPLPA